MQALGHSSKAIHRAYSRKAQVKLPAARRLRAEDCAIDKPNRGKNGQCNTTVQTARALSEEAI